ncbi:L-serine ammonia-lyase [Marinicella gelatinilytica]|uniref:L-serine ammonia-lyase n=1 Tax=Marinicella gelatinilytica TaxID=2996017 RepID=UPI002260FA97|nr:L-serine ammonia-lyase [Marinicella gelatinilytica]MCX7545468.1 L-serine ammonia-lyase [Marinicella gelatinilytica]
MAVSIFDLFKIGIGPSSSHTVGPMRAAHLFTQYLHNHDLATKTHHVVSELYGSLSHTGRGHGTDKAIILGLSGEQPDTVDPDNIPTILETVKNTQQIINQDLNLVFKDKDHLKFHKRKKLPLHTNGMQFTAYDKAGNELAQKAYYSVGGGFVLSHNHMQEQHIMEDNSAVPHHFESGDQLIEICNQKNLTIAEVMYANEETWRSRSEIDQQLDTIWQAMEQCMQRGFITQGTLPGGLNLPRRASKLYRELNKKTAKDLADPLTVLDWVSVYALAVSEENAAGGRVVTAPTNGAAGIIPAVIYYYLNFVTDSNQQGIRDFLLTAAAVGILYKTKASISGAEVGCQGEVGVASSMAAAGLAAACGLTMDEVENAAEIAMEHNLGLTCDPIGGLVQIPCIERNAMGSIKAISAFRMADRNEGSHYVSLDKVIKTMKATGDDMKDSYKETSRGGLAVNIIEC